jgi:hypothetical protein
MGTFLQSMAQDERVVKVNEKSVGVFEIVDVDRASALYRKFKLEVVASEVEGEAVCASLVEVLYSVPKRLKGMFESPPGVLLSKCDARTILLVRVKDRGLLMQDRSGWVRLDEELQTALKVW